MPVIQLISPEAREKQMVFARWSTHKCINDLGFLQNLWWSDEAQGTLQSTSDEKAGLQQDGAPPHTARVSIEWLGAHVPGELWGKVQCRVDPPSPDLTPPDFFLRGFVKRKVT